MVNRIIIDQTIDRIIRNSKRGMSEELQLFLRTVGKETSKESSKLQELYDAKSDDFKYLESDKEHSEHEFHNLVIESVQKKLQQLDPQSALPSNSLKHEDLIQLTRLLYPDAISEGICHGFSLMILQAALSDNLPKFYLRLADLADLLKECKENHEGVIKLIQDKGDIDLLAFFEDLHVCMEGFKYGELFSTTKPPCSQQDATFLPSVLAIVGSDQLQKKGPIHQTICATEIYNQEELTRFFDNLKTSILSHSQSTTPISFLIDTISHSTSVIYDRKTNKWLIADINHPSPVAYTATELAEVMIQQLFFNVVGGKIALHTRYVYTESDGNALISWKNRTERGLQNSIWDQIRAFYVDFETLLQPSPRGLIEQQLNHLLYLASCDNDLSAVQDALKRGAIVNQTTVRGFTPLYIAAQNGHKEIVQLLLQQKEIDVNQTTMKGFTPLFIATQMGHTEVVQLLLNKGANVNQVMANGASPLYVAVYQGDIDIVQLLLDKGADPHLIGNDREMLLKGAEAKGHEDVAALLRAWKPK